MLSVTDPFPEPEAGLTVTNGAPVAAAVHAGGSQFDGETVTLTVDVAAALPTVTVVGETAKVHGSLRESLSARRVLAEMHPVSKKGDPIFELEILIHDPYSLY